MPAKDERRELAPVIIATIVAAIGGVFVWSDLRNDSLDRGDGTITSAVVSRAGATVAPSEPPLAVRRTMLASELRWSAADTHARLAEHYNKYGLGFSLLQQTLTHEPAGADHGRGR